MSIPSVSDPSYAKTLTAETPWVVPVPSTWCTAIFTKSAGDAEEDFWVTPLTIGGSAPVDFTAATSGVITVDFGAAVAGGDNTGLADDTTEYTATLTVDGGEAQEIAIVGEDAQTFTELLSELNAATEGGTWTIGDGDLVFTATSTGASSTVSLVDGEADGLIDALSGSVDEENGSDIVYNKSPILNPTQLRCIGINSISIESTGTPTVSVTFSTK